MSGGQSFPPTATANFIIHENDPSGRRLSLLSTGDEVILQGAVNSMHLGPPMDLNKAIVAVGVTATSPACQNQLAGWQFTLTDLDGGTLPSDPDAGSPYVLLYLNSNSEPASGASQTSSRGAAVFYNVETTVSPIYFQATNTNPDAGCLPTTTPLEFTGTVMNSPGAITFAPISLP